MATLTLKTNRFGWLLGKLGLHRPVRLDVHPEADVAPKNVAPSNSAARSSMDSRRTGGTFASKTAPLPPSAPETPVNLEVQDASFTPDLEVVSVVDGAEAVSGPQTASRRESGGRGSEDGDDDKPQSFQEMTGLIRSVRGQLNQQSDRSQRIIELMQSIPEAIGTLPEINRNQMRLVEAVNTQLEQDERRGAALSRSLQGLLEVSERQTQMMGLVQQRLDQTQQTEAKVVGGLQAMNQALGRMGETGLAQTQTLRELLEQRRVSDLRLEQMIQDQARTGRLMIAANWAMAGAALGLAVWALIG